MAEKKLTSSEAGNVPAGIEVDGQPTLPAQGESGQEMLSLPGTRREQEALAGWLELDNPRALTLQLIVDAVGKAQQTMDEMRAALQKAKGDTVRAVMQARRNEGTVTVSEDDAAELILSKLGGEVRDLFERTHVDLYPTDSKANVIAALINTLTEHSEAHTGDFDSINRAPVTMQVRGGQRVASVTGTALTPASYGLDPHPCKACGITFTPRKRGQTFGCDGCGYYATHVQIVAKDNEMHSRVPGDPRHSWVRRRPLAFDTFLHQERLTCTCGQVATGYDAPGAPFVPLAERVRGTAITTPVDTPTPFDEGADMMPAWDPENEDPNQGRRSGRRSAQPSPPDEQGEYWGVDPAVVGAQARSELEKAQPRGDSYPLMPPGMRR